MARAGFNPAGFGEHSLRAGFATEAARNGAAFDVMRQTGHRSIATVSRYVRDAQIFRDAPAGKARALKQLSGQQGRAPGVEMRSSS